MRHRFCKCEEGTTRWTTEPILSQHVSTHISGLARNAGIPHGTAYGFRKNAAEDVCALSFLTLDQILTSCFLCSTSYSRGKTPPT